MSGCSGQKIKQTLLADAGYDRIEITFLSLARCFFLSYAEPETQAWEIAFVKSHRDLGPEIGALFAQETLKIVQAMRLSRRSIFCFSNPRCPCCCDKLSDHERNLMNAFIAIRCNKKSEAHLHAMILCEGHSTETLLQNMSHMVQHFSLHKEQRHDEALLPAS